MLSTCQDICLATYLTIIGLLEYASVVWDPHHISYSYNRTKCIHDILYTLYSYTFVN